MSRDYKLYLEDMQIKGGSSLVMQSCTQALNPFRGFRLSAKLAFFESFSLNVFD